ncbi:MAG: tetratricopeptide repeat protein [Planctomycetes bacterium]|nr:tetratricopeptide repeat protein [Planctomycetota bacterium]
MSAKLAILLSLLTLCACSSAPPDHEAPAARSAPDDSPPPTDSPDVDSAAGPQDPLATPAARPIPFRSLESHFEVGLKALDDAEWQLALDEFAAVIRHQQDVPGAYANRSVAWDRLGEPGEAIADLTVAERLCATQSSGPLAEMRPALHLMRADLRRRLGAHANALADCDAGLRLAEADAALHRERAKLLFAMGRRDEAEAAGARALELDPRLGAVPMPAELEAAHARIVAAGDEPQDPALFLARAEQELALARDGEHAELFEDAMADFRHAARLAPRDARAWLRCGIAEEARPARRGAFFVGPSAEAIAYYSRAIAIDRDLAEAWHRRGLAKLADGGLGLAFAEESEKDALLADLDRAFALGYRTPEACLARVRFQKAAGRTARVVEELSAALEREPDHVEALTMRAEALASLRRFDEAIADQSRVVESSGGSGEARVARARLFERAKRWEEALRDWTAVADGVEPAVRQAAIGDCELELGHFDRALAAFDEAVALAPTHAEHRLGRARALRLAGNAERALAEYRKARELDAKVPEIAADLANAAELDADRAWAGMRRAAGEFGDALAEQNEAAAELRRLEEEKERLEQELAESARRLAETPQQRIERLTRTIDAGGAKPEDLEARADAYLETGDARHAVADYTAALVDAVDSARLWAKLGAAMLAADPAQPQAAKPSLDHALELDPKLAMAWNRRGVVNELSGDLKAALADQDRALALEPDQPQFLSDRADVKAGLEDHAGARADYTRAIELVGEHEGRWRLHFNRGNSCFQLGDFAAAIADYDVVIAVQPDFEPAKQNREIALRRQQAR